MPISGRPPSLINAARRLLVPSALPVRARRRTSAWSPTLEPVEDDPTHQVACLLDHATRQRIWQDLRAGSSAEEARVKLVERTDAAAASAPPEGGVA